LLHKFGTLQELKRKASLFPERLVRECAACIKILNQSYGEERNYFMTGGYVIVAENENDLLPLQEIVDYERRPCEFVFRVGNTAYLSVLYLLGDDFGIVVFLPLEIATDEMLKFKKEGSYEDTYYHTFH